MRTRNFNRATREFTDDKPDFFIGAKTPNGIFPVMVVARHGLFYETLGDARKDLDNMGVAEILFSHIAAN